MERQGTCFGTGDAKEPGECGGLQTSHCAEADALPGITETFYPVTAERRFPNSVVLMLIEHATGGVPAAARALIDSVTEGEVRRAHMLITSVETWGIMWLLNVTFIATNFDGPQTTQHNPAR